MCVQADMNVLLNRYGIPAVLQALCHAVLARGEEAAEGDLWVDLMCVASNYEEALKSYGPRE